MSIILPIMIIGGIGLLAGIILAIAAHIFAVPTDETADAVRVILPGANCGACGYSGCDGYAKALAHDDAAVNLCAPGGESVATQIANLLGKEAVALERRAAIIHCSGTCEQTHPKMIYSGIPSCQGANQFFAGPGSCSFGCLGYGDCATVCSYDAICLRGGIAVVQSDRCRGCGACIKECPKHLISLVPIRPVATVRCSNHDKGAQTRKSCSVGCIGCMKCAKACPESAIAVDTFCATVDTAKCIGCGKCVAQCPSQCLSLLFSAL